MHIPISILTKWIVPKSTGDFLACWNNDGGPVWKKIGRAEFLLAYGGLFGRKETQDALKKDPTLCRKSK